METGTVKPPKALTNIPWKGKVMLPFVVVMEYI
jgi:hypothetical protein